MITDFEFNDLLSKLQNKSKCLTVSDNYTYDFHQTKYQNIIMSQFMAVDKIRYL